MECYGHFGKVKSKNCADCEFEASCRYYTGLPKDISRSGYESMDAGNFNADSHSDALHLEKGLPNTRLTMQDLADFAHFLIELDDITLGMVIEVVRGARSISELAKSAGLSRWCVHRRVLTTISRVPELTELFATLMPRLSAARRRFLLGSNSYHRRTNFKEKPKK